MMSNENNKDRTDLTVIKGIGKSREQWLRDSLDVQSLRDLGEMSVDEIEARLKAEGRIASRTEIGKWIEQAIAIVEAESTSQVVPSRQSGSTGAESADWKPFASFVVEYQTRTLADGTQEHQTTAHFMEADHNATWPGIVSEPIPKWIATQIDVADDTEAPPTIQEAIPVVEPAPLPEETSDDVVEITSLRAFQPTQTMVHAGSSKAGQPFLGTLKSGEPFALEAALKLRTTRADIRNSKYTAQFYAYNTSTGATLHLGDTPPQSLGEEKTLQPALLPEANLTRGLYRLRVYATIQSTPPAKSYMEVPFCRVI